MSLLRLSRATYQTTLSASRTGTCHSRNQLICAARRMSSTSTPEKFEWLVILPDAVGKYEKRMEVRPKHFEGIKSNVSSGLLKMGGALLDAPPAAGSSPKIVGSAIVVVASSREEVMEGVKKDVYAEHDVWDLEKIQIYPFKCAYRETLNM